jgi:hypothetical protein
MTSQHDATLYSTLTAGSRFSASSQTCHSDDGSRESEVGSRKNGPPTFRIVASERVKLMKVIKVIKVMNFSGAG